MPVVKPVQGSSSNATIGTIIGNIFGRGVTTTPITQPSVPKVGLTKPQPPTVPVGPFRPKNTPPALVVPVTVSPVVPVITPVIPTANPLPTPPIVPVSGPGSVSPIIIAPTSTLGDKNVNVLVQKGTDNSSLGCEIVNQYYSERKKVAQYKWKSFNADKVTINGKLINVNSGDLTNSEITFDGKKSTVFELVVSKAGETKTCRVVVPPILAKCTVTLTENKLDKSYVDYRVTFPRVLGAPYLLRVYDTRGYMVSNFRTIENESPTSLTYTGRLLKISIGEKKAVQFLTRIDFPTNLETSMMHNSKCVTKYTPGLVKALPVQGSPGFGNGDGYTAPSAPNTPQTGTTPTANPGPINSGNVNQFNVY